MGAILAELTLVGLGVVGREGDLRGAISGSAGRRLSRPGTTGIEDGIADDPDAAPDGAGEVLFTSTVERRGQPHLPCFTGWLADAVLSAAPAAALETDEGLDILEMVSDDDVELEETDEADDGKNRTILIERKVWVTCTRAVISNAFYSDKAGKGEGADSLS